VSWWSRGERRCAFGKRIVSLFSSDQSSHPFLLPSVAAVLAHTMVDIVTRLRPVAPASDHTLAQRGLRLVNLLTVSGRRTLVAGKAAVRTVDIFWADRKRITRYLVDSLRHRLLLKRSGVSGGADQIRPTIVHMVLAKSAAAFADVLLLHAADRVTLPGADTAVRLCRFLHESILALRSDTINSEDRRFCLMI